uniref:Uncharacterized protein n=1 Tax=Arundo donax TaxID=35708 RepID=A0A0A9C8H3_ARUDO
MLSMRNGQDLTKITMKSKGKIEFTPNSNKKNWLLGEVSPSGNPRDQKSDVQLYEKGKCVPC